LLKLAETLLSTSIPC